MYYASVQYGYECMCDSGIGKDYQKYGPAEGCDMPCPQPNTGFCGGSLKNAVFDTGYREWFLTLFDIDTPDWKTPE